jgi:hypothetical protein
LPFGPLFHDHRAGFVEGTSGFQADVCAIHPFAQDPGAVGTAPRPANLDVGVGERDEAFHVAVVQGIVPGDYGLDLRAHVSGGLGEAHPPPVGTYWAWFSRENLFEVPVMG